jgi:transposase, IS5 family
VCLSLADGCGIRAPVSSLPTTRNPYDAYAPATFIPAIQVIIGNTLDRVIVDAGYRGHNGSPE